MAGPFRGRLVAGLVSPAGEALRQAPVRAERLEERRKLGALLEACRRAVRFAEYGANVAINYLRRPEEARGAENEVHACVSKVRSEGVRGILVRGDPSREEDVVRGRGWAAVSRGLGLGPSLGRLSESKTDVLPSPS